MIKTVYGDKQDVSAGNFLFEISVPAVEGYKPVGVVGYNINQRAYDMNITCVLLYTSSIARIAGKAYENSKSITPEVRVLYIGA